jgi:hypothetical protein
MADELLPPSDRLEVGDEIAHGLTSDVALLALTEIRGGGSGGGGPAAGDATSAMVGCALLLS